MPVHRFLKLFRGSKGIQKQSQGSVDGGFSAEIESLENLLASIQSELEAVNQATRTLRLDLIPLSLLQADAPPIADPASPGMPGDPCHTDVQRARLDRLRDLLALAGQERSYLQQLLAILRSAMSWEEAGAELRTLCLKPFELSGFYLAQADWSAGMIRFPFFYEAGHAKEAEPIALDPASGLTGWALFAGEPCYLDCKEACRARGMRLTEAELRSGLHTQSWFGAPLPSRDPARPLGLMAFHCYHARAFPRDRRELMTRTALLTAMHLANLRADP